MPAKSLETHKEHCLELPQGACLKERGNKNHDVECASQHGNTGLFHSQSKITKERKHAASKKSFHRLKPCPIIENHVADRSEVRHKTLAPSNSWETELSSSMIYVQTSAADLSYPFAVWCSKRVRTHQVAKCVLSICRKCRVLVTSPCVASVGTVSASCLQNCRVTQLHLHVVKFLNM